MTHFHVLAHPLRRFTIAAFFPALILSIIDACLSGPKRIAGFSTIFVSAIVSTILLCCKRRNTESKHRSFGVPILLLIFDTILAAGILAFLIFTWVHIADRWGDTGKAVLKAYATMPYILVFCIHAYLALLNLITLIDQPRVCPRCEGDMHPRPSESTPGFGPSQDFRGGYRSLHEVDQAVERPSVDTLADEDARLLGDEESRVGLVKNPVPSSIGGAGKDGTTVHIV